LRNVPANFHSKVLVRKLGYKLLDLAPVSSESSFVTDSYRCLIAPPRRPRRSRSLSSSGSAR
ncbi:MAG: hypothetical protein ABFD97_10160, partial [Syntrophobacter sp.]